MQFTYRFPAVKGIQAGKEYYISMVPLKLLDKLFPQDDDIVLPEYRAQRKINEARIPEITNYILNNRDTYVFSALSASIDGKFRFIPSTMTEVGILEVDMDAVFLINDGQHRKAAIAAAMNEDSSLESETISIVFFEDGGLSRSQQMFTDLNKHAVKTSNSLATLYDSRDAIAVATREIIEAIPFFNKYTDKERDILGKNSAHLFTLNTIYKSNKRILHGNQCTDEDFHFLLEYWQLLSSNITEWQEVLDKQLTKKSLKEDYIVTLGITINAFGKLGRVFYDDRNLCFTNYIDRFSRIDWLRVNRDWIGRAIREDGKVLNSDEAATLICSQIKKSLQLPLTKEEQAKEKLVQEKK